MLISKWSMVVHPLCDTFEVISTHFADDLCDADSESRALMVSGSLQPGAIRG
jgi:hypothetical protein